MSLMSAAFRAEAAKRGNQAPEIYLVLELGAPFNMKLGSIGVSSDALGSIDPRVTAWGTFRRAVDPLSHTLADWEANVEITDADHDPAKRRRVARIVAAGHWRRASATIRAISPNVPDADSWRPVVAILHNAQQTRPFIWSLSIRPDDGPLRNGRVPKLPISAFFPAAHDDVRSFFVPVLYGKFNGSGAGNQGMVPLYLADAAASKYILGQAWCNACSAVYDPEGVIISSEAYTFTREAINGAIFSTVTFTAPRTEPVLYADAEGLTANADGTGGLLINPAEQMRHLARNFIWGDYRSGAYITTSPVNSAAIDALAEFLDAMGHEGSFWLGGEGEMPRGLDVVNQFLDSEGVYAFWSNAGEIIFKAIDHRPPADIYSTNYPWVRADTDEQRAFATPSDPDVIEKGVTVSYVPDRARPGYKATLRVVDKSVTEDVIGSLSLPWSASRMV